MKPLFGDKPNPLMMHTALNYLDVHSADNVMVGDRMDTDITAGVNSSWRWARLHAVLCWIIAASVWGVQLVVLLWPRARVIRLVFPDWPVDAAYEAYLRGIALADVVFLQPLLALTGVGLWQMRRWGLIGALTVAGAAVYFGIIQVTAEVLMESQYHLYGMGVLARPFVGTPLFELTNWTGLLGWVLYPIILGLYGARKILCQTTSTGP